MEFIIIMSVLGIVIFSFLFGVLYGEKIERDKARELADLEIPIAETKDHTGFIYATTKKIF